MHAVQILLPGTPLNDHEAIAKVTSESHPLFPSLTLAVECCMEFLLGEDILCHFKGRL